MKRFSALLLTLILMAGLVTPAPAQILDAIFGPPKVTARGVVNSIAPNHFTVIGKDSKFARIFVPEGKRLPAEVQIGVEVVVVAIVGENNLYVLDHFEEIRLTPAP